MIYKWAEPPDQAAGSGASNPLEEMRLALRNIRYDGYASFEWEKKWHAQIPAADVALPHFARWFRENWHG